LTQGTTYYWKIVTYDASGTCTSTSAVWSFTTCSPPTAASTPSPGDAATNQATTSTLSWTGSGSTYDVIMEASNPAPTTVVSAGQAVTTYDPGPLASATTYYWKIVTYDASGTCTSTSAVWSFTTCTAPAVASAPSPADLATGLATNTTLSWTGAGSTYDVIFEASNPAPTTVVSPGQAVTTYDPGLLTEGTTYYWKIVSYNGGCSSTSPIWSFTICSSPAVASAPSPADLATGIGTSDTLSWTGSGSTYDVILEASNPAPTTVVSAGQAVATYNPAGLLEGTTYYWKIVSYDAGGNCSSTSAVWSFTTCTAPATASTPSPADLATGVGTVDTLSWTGSGSTYDVILEASNPAPTTVVSTGQGGTTYDPGGLNPSTTYYWKIVSYDASGNCSSTTAVWSFTTCTAPAVASTPSPADLATDQATSATLSWTGSGNTYDVIMEAGNPSPTTVVSASQAVTTYNPAGLSNSTTYYWKIVSYDVSGTCASTSPVWSFSTICATPGSPTTPSPADVATGVAPGVVALSWSGSAATYDVVLDTNPSPSTPLCTGIATTSCNTGTLAGGTTYYWKVVAKNGTCVDPSPSIWSFTTASAIQGKALNPGWNLVVMSQIYTAGGTLSVTGNEVFSDDSGSYSPFMIEWINNGVGNTVWNCGTPDCKWSGNVAANTLKEVQGYSFYAHGSGLALDIPQGNFADLISTPISSVTYNLNHGGNLVGSPYSQPVKLNVSGAGGVKIIRDPQGLTTGPEELTFEQAADPTRLWVEPVIYYYEGTYAGYTQKHCADDADNDMLPWTAYWIRVLDTNDDYAIKFVSP